MGNAKKIIVSVFVFFILGMFCSILFVRPYAYKKDEENIRETAKIATEWIDEASGKVTTIFPENAEIHKEAKGFKKEANILKKELLSCGDDPCYSRSVRKIRKLSVEFEIFVKKCREKYVEGKERKKDIISI